MEKKGITLPPEDLPDVLARHARIKQEMRSYGSRNDELVEAQQLMDKEVQQFILSIKSY